MVNGDFYTGNWKNNQKSGQGTHSFSGNKYIGDFSEDLGRGSVLYSNNDHYDGYWSEGNYHGRGTLIQYNGDSYTGNFKNGEYHGNGKLTTIEGVVKNGER
ncbi:4 [Hexamita inflata]|uniref:4 n=1 Tax=Hexamita inflata TaxID=28002 RepID=A0AA86R8H3_9EUKA|nr:4 [Hexamita inflata] [Hexamita inflata]